MRGRLPVSAAGPILPAAGVIVPAHVVFKTLQVTATITLALAAGFVLYLILAGRRRRAARRY